MKGHENSINYKFRMHDSRIGRFFAVDPLAGKYPHNSPYAFSENIVISSVELEGVEVEENPNEIVNPEENKSEPNKNAESDWINDFGGSQGGSSEPSDFGGFKPTSVKAPIWNDPDPESQNGLFDRFCNSYAPYQEMLSQMISNEEWGDNSSLDPAESAKEDIVRFIQGIGLDGKLRDETPEGAQPVQIKLASVNF